MQKIGVTKLINKFKNSQNLRTIPVRIKKKDIKNLRLLMLYNKVIDSSMGYYTINIANYLPYPPLRRAEYQYCDHSFRDYFYVDIHKTQGNDIIFDKSSSIGYLEKDKKGKIVSKYYPDYDLIITKKDKHIIENIHTVVSKFGLNNIKPFLDQYVERPLLELHIFEIELFKKCKKLNMTDNEIRTIIGYFYGVLFNIRYERKRELNIPSSSNASSMVIVNNYIDQIPASILDEYDKFAGTVRLV
jgi:hypothetical protein